MKLCLSTDETVRAVALRCRWQDYACWTLRCQWLLSGVSPVCRLCISQQHFVVVRQLRLNKLNTVGWMTRGTASCSNNPKGSPSGDPTQPQVTAKMFSWAQSGLVQNSGWEKVTNKRQGELTLTGKSGLRLESCPTFCIIVKNWVCICVCLWR